jgi:hypothetical protein
LSSFTALDFALGYIDMGLCPIPIPYREKGPTIEKWTELRITPETAPQYFNGAPQNIGIILGETSKNLVDVDIDCIEALAVAPFLLPATSGRFGRASKRASHWLYFSNVPKHIKYEDPNIDGPGKTIVELRSGGVQTVFPGSVHVTGEPIELEDDADFATIPQVTQEVLEEAVGKVAAASLLARYFPQKGRHDFCLALGGGLLRDGWTVDDAEMFVGIVAWVGGSDKPRERAASVRGTAEKFDAGEPVTGWKRVSELIADRPLGGGIGGKKLVSRARKWLPAKKEPIGDAKIIPLGADLHRVVAATLAALPNDPDTYQRDGQLVRVVRVAEAEAEKEKMSAGTPQIRAFGLAVLKVKLTHVVSFQKYSLTSEAWVDTTPPDDVTAAVKDWGEYPGVQPVTGIIETPSMRPDGSLITEPGYDAATGYIYAPQHEFPPIADHLTHDDARRALTELLEPYVDFPFKDEASRHVPVAALLTLVCRPAIRGAVPGFVFDASTQGSGKGLCASAVTALAHGRPAAVMTWPSGDRDDEVEKILAGYAVRAASVILWDNIDKSVFGGAPLDKVLTAVDRVELRILGQTKVPSLTWRTVILATGNNIMLGADTTRRVLMCRLEPLMEHPEERTNFVIKGDLIAWCMTQHPRMVAAALTLLRAYVLAGRPKREGTTGWGSFDLWRELIGEAIVWAGGADVMATRPTFDKTTDDPEKAALRTVFEQLPRLLPEGGTVREIVDKLYPEWGAPDPTFTTLRDALESLAPPHKKGQPPDTGKLGKAFRKARRRVLGDRALGSRWIDIVSTHAGTAKWCVFLVTPPEK